MHQFLLRSVVADNNTLDDVLLARLKHRDHFQGARHELFAEATCLRAGFTVEHENERDGTRKHVEFVAVHKATGQRLSVEAKSKLYNVSYVLSGYGTSGKRFGTPPASRIGPHISQGTVSAARGRSPWRWVL